MLPLAGLLFVSDEHVMRLQEERLPQNSMLLCGVDHAV